MDIWPYLNVCMFSHVEETFMEFQEKKYTEWKNDMSTVSPFIVCFAQKSQAEWTEARTGAEHRLPLGRDAGAPARSFRTGGPPGALHRRAPLPGGGVVTVDIRGWSFRQSFPHQFYFSFGIYSLFSFSQSPNSSVNSWTWMFLSRSHHIHLHQTFVSDALCMAWCWEFCRFG